jgi:hypothetical protein
MPVEITTELVSLSKTQTCIFHTHGLRPGSECRRSAGNFKRITTWLEVYRKTLGLDTVPSCASSLQNLLCHPLAALQPLSDRIEDGRHYRLSFIPA